MNGWIQSWDGHANCRRVREPAPREWAGGTTGYDAYCPGDDGGADRAGGHFISRDLLSGRVIEGW